MGKESKWTFFGHFFAAYGFQWFVLVFVAFVSSTHIQAGQFGYYGLPAIAFIYGFIRALMDKNAAQSKTEMMERIYSIDTKVTLIKRLVKQIDSGKGEAASTEES